jgi:DNA-3-methyladenine glycosylase I
MNAAMERTAILHADGKKRCPWPGTDPFYVAYHDTDWGVPETDDRALFEKLILDGFQAGLSWITILRKRENFRRAFEDFEPERIVRFTPERVEALMQDAGIIRNRAKIEGTIRGARLWLEMMERGSFARHLWGFVDGAPVQGHFRHHGEVPTQTKIAEALSKDLKGRGFSFVGPTIVYAFMQAVGMVNDHLVDCYRHPECAELGRQIRW